MSGTTERGAKILLAASIALALAGAGCGSSDYALRRDADQRLSDRVGRELSTAPALSAAKVEARSHWGVVALVGEAPDEESKREAERIARAVAGVARVNNLILVVKGDSRAEGSAPAKGALILARTN
ncbi:MAG TPA: BON domain-containing protein [Thermoanaerobaculia bacterium]|jgi:osmotically-inducible protein OsmY|nr:BON domain-containing protein [Thermoanaerobaculia bacterium]